MILAVEKHEAFFSSSLLKTLLDLHRLGLQPLIMRILKPTQQLFQVSSKTLEISFYFHGHMLHFDGAFHFSLLLGGLQVTPPPM